MTGIVHISQRLAEAADRAVRWHWEGDRLLTALLLVVVLSRRLRASSQLESAGDRMGIAGLALADVRYLTTYGMPEYAPIPNVGFPLQTIGFIVVAAATVLLGTALGINRRLSTVTAGVMGALGPVSLILGGLGS